MFYGGVLKTLQVLRGPGPLALLQTVTLGTVESEQDLAQCVYQRTAW